MNTLIEIIKNKKEQGIEWNFIEDLHKAYIEMTGRETHIQATYRKLRTAEQKRHLLESRFEDREGKGNKRLQYSLCIEKKNLPGREKRKKNRKKKYAKNFTLC